MAMELDVIQKSLIDHIKLYYNEARSCYVVVSTGRVLVWFTGHGGCVLGECEEITKAWVLGAVVRSGLTSNWIRE